MSDGVVAISEAGMRRCTSLLAFAVFFMISGILLADHRDQADAATRRLHDAEARLRAVQCDIDRARAALDAAVANRCAALGQYDQVARLANASSVCISDAQSKLDGAVAAARDWGARATERRTVFDEAKTRADNAVAEAEQYRAAAIANFEASPDFTAAMKALQDAAAAHQAEITAATDFLRSTDVYSDLYDIVEETEVEVVAQRAMVPQNAIMLAGASEAWMMAKASLAQLKQAFLDRDPWVIATKQRIDATTKVRDDLVAQFNQSLASDAEYARLSNLAATAQNDANAVAEEVNAAEQARAAAESDIARWQSVIASEQAKIQQFQNDLAGFRASAESYSFAVSSADAQLRRLCDIERFARGDYEAAARELRIVIERADADHVRHEIDQHQRDRQRQAEFAAANNLIAEQHRNATEFEARRRAEAQVREQRRDFDREREDRARDHHQPPPREPDVKQQQTDAQRIARAEQAVKEAQARDAAKLATAKEAADRNAQQRDSHQQRAAEREAQQKQQQQQQRDAEDRAAREHAAREAKEARDTHESAARERQNRERDAKERESKDREAHEQADRDRREAQAREQRETQAREQRESRERDQRESESRQREAQAKEQREAQAREQRESREREARESREREQRESQARQREQEQRDRQERERQQQENDRRADDDRRRNDEAHARREAEQKDRDRDNKFRK